MNASEQIDQYIAGIRDWRGEMLAGLRQLVLESDADIAEEWKWGSPVWSRNGLVCSASAFKDHVKINFFQGAALADPDKLFNAGLEAKKTRAIDFHEGDAIHESALKELVRRAVAHNARKK
jgi:hypothetical protein